MSAKSDYFYSLLRQIYPNINRPLQLEEQIWAELLESYTEEEILKAVKSFRTDVDTPFPPTPAKLKEYLVHRTSSKPTCHGFSLVEHLIQQDQKAGRLVYFYGTYREAVEYVLTEKLRAYMNDDEAFRKLDHQGRVDLAIDYGLFADFDDSLTLVAKRRGEYHE
jgi:hypothetical protein